MNLKIIVFLLALLIPWSASVACDTNRAEWMLIHNTIITGQYRDVLQEEKELFAKTKECFAAAEGEETDNGHCKAFMGASIDEIGPKKKQLLQKFEKEAEAIWRLGCASLSKISEEVELAIGRLKESIKDLEKTKRRLERKEFTI